MSSCCKNKIIQISRKFGYWYTYGIIIYQIMQYNSFVQNNYNNYNTEILVT